MAIDFTFPPDIDALRLKVRDFIAQVVRPAEAKIAEREGDRRFLIQSIIEMRVAAHDWGLWLPHMPKEYGGMGLGHVAMAAVSAEAAKSAFGPYALNAQAPDEGNMHTLLHWGTEAQKEKYLRPLCEGKIRSCFAMTEPEVAGSDPTLIQTRAVPDGDQWVVDGHKWFISGATGAKFAILIARTEDTPEIPQARNSAFLIDLPAKGWTVVRDVKTMAGHHNHAEIRIEGLRLPKDNMLGARGQGHLLGQARLGPARLAHCMRWIGQAEIALDMLVDRALNRYAHGSFLAEKQGIQWMIADSTMELYQASSWSYMRPSRSTVERTSAARCRWQSTSSRVRSIESSIAQSRCTAPLATRSTRRLRAWPSKHAGPASPMAPTKCTNGVSPNAR